MGHENTPQSFPGYYLEHLDVRQANMFNALIKMVPPHEIYAFVKGCSAIYEFMQEIHTDVVFYPLRGAMPIAWTIRSLAQNTAGHEMNEIHLPLGTHLKIPEGGFSGLKGNQKRTAIRLAVQRLRESNQTPQNPTLIDEAQSGSTISQAAIHLRQALDDFFPGSPLHVIVAQDDRKHIINRRKRTSYRILVSNEHPSIHAAVIPLPLFIVDRESLLDTLLLPTDAPKEQQATLIHIMHNTVARESFDIIATLVTNPRLTQMLVDLFTTEKSPVWTPELTKIYSWFIENLTHPRNGKPPSVDRIVAWLCGIVDCANDDSSH